jgi:hypothetical protein
MRYIETKTLNCQIYAVQRRELDRIKSEIESEYNIKIPYLNWCKGHGLLVFLRLMLIAVLPLN